MHTALAVARADPRALALIIAKERRDRYAHAAKADNTRLAYARDWRHFEAWALEHQVECLPATPETVSLYLADLADRGYKSATIGRRIASISVAHDAAGWAEQNPTHSTSVRFVFAGIKRVHGSASEGKAPALVEDVAVMVAAMGGPRWIRQNLADVRDRAILLVGFAGAFRRSELVALDVEDLVFSRAGVAITLRRSKTDQEGAGRRVGLPRGANPATCPVRALRALLDAYGGSGATGPIFRRLDRHGHWLARLSDQSVALIVKRRAAAAGLDAAHMAGHSLRAGFATSAMRAKVSEERAMRQTGHKSVAVFRKYVRDAELFDGELSKLGL